ncbi:667_t:CDS:1, partial [Cetraspora pellucida]
MSLEYLSNFCENLFKNKKEKISFKYLHDICENLFQNKKEIVLDIIQKNSNTKDIIYKERLDAVCNHLLKRFENEEKYIETPEDIEFLNELSDSIKKKLNSTYLFFQDKKISDVILMNMFTREPLSIYGKHMKLSYNYYRIQLLLSHASEFEYSEYLDIINNLFSKRLDKTLLKYFDLHTTDSIFSKDLLSIVLLAESFYFKYARKDFLPNNPIKLQYLVKYKKYSDYKKSKELEATDLCG